MIFAIVLFVVFGAKVYAKENEYFVNSNGVAMTEIEYNNIKMIHGENFVETIDYETYNKYQDFYSEENLEIDEISNNSIIPYSSVHSTNYKELSITSAKYNNVKMITIKLNWKKLPSVKSYDVFGFYIPNNSYYDVSSFSNFYGSFTKAVGTVKQTNNGYGISIKLPADCNQIAMQIVFKTTGNRTVFASYQHSVRGITLSNSTNYTFSNNGLGNVFLFNDISLFDQMSGVNITI